MFTNDRDPHETWNGLALFESHDFVQSWYRKRHGGKVNATWTQEIAASFQQGREYFESARSAGAAVKPLLIYYGCAALARGATLLLMAKLLPGALSSTWLSRVYRWSATILA